MSDPGAECETSRKELQFRITFETRKLLSRLEKVLVLDRHPTGEWTQDAEIPEQCYRSSWCSTWVQIVSANM